MKNNFTSSKKPKIGFVALLLFFCVLWGNGAMGQDLISDGGFETQTTISGVTNPWYSASGGISFTTTNPRTGTKALLWGTTFRTLNQAFTAVPGTTYIGTYYVRSNQTSVTGDGNVYVNITDGSNVALLPPISSVTAPFSSSANGYVKYTFIFTAPQANLTLAMSKGTGNSTINLDDISIVPTVLPTSSDPLSSSGPYSFPFVTATPQGPTFTANPVVTITYTYRGSAYNNPTAPINAGAYNAVAYIANGLGRDYLIVPYIITGIPTVSTLPASLVNNGQALSTATFTSGVASVPGTYAFNNPSTVPSIGPSSQDYTFTPTDTANFANVTGTLTVISGQVFGWNVSTLAGGTNSFGTQGLAATTSNSNVTVGGLTRGPGLTTTGTGAARGWGGVAVLTTTQASAITANQFITFSVKPTNSGTTLSLNSIDPFSYRRSGTGPTAGALQYATDGINFTDITTSIAFSAAANTAASIPSIDLSGIAALQNIPSTTTITFRLVPFSSNAGGTFYIFDTAVSTQSDFSVQGTVITTSTYTTSWDNGTPTASVNAIIDGDYTSGSFTCNDLTVNLTKTLTVATGTSVTVAGALVNNGTITVENNANLIQTAVANTNSGTGTDIVKRNSNPLLRLDYTMWSSPVAGSQTLAQFSPLTSQSPNRFYTYNPGTDAYNAANFSAPFATGTGYLIRMPNEGSANYNAGTETLAYPGEFTGTLNNGTVTLSGLTSDKFYAVGNPYPSTLDAVEFVAANPSTLYFWRKTNGVANVAGTSATGTAYATWTTLGSAASETGTNNIVSNGTIQVGQGFIVKTGVAATSIVFTNDMRNGTASTQFFKTRALAEKSRVWLNLTTTAGVFSQALVGYVDGATLGVDNGIDGKYINDSAIALTSNINGEEYTIQGRPAFDASDVVALNFKTDVAGDYTIALDHFDGVFATGQGVYLLDSKTGAETDLKSSSYTFNALSGTNNTRFSLKYQKTLKVDAAAFNENSVRAYKNNGTLYVNSGNVAISNIKIFDIQGRLIAEQKNLKATTAVFNNLKATHQVLIVKISGEDNNVVTKKVVN